MAFRRLPGVAENTPLGELPIPQDSQDSDDDDEDTLFAELRTAEDDGVVAGNFSMLPSLEEDSDG